MLAKVTVKMPGKAETPGTVPKNRNMKNVKLVVERGENRSLINNIIGFENQFSPSLKGHLKLVAKEMCLQIF